MDKAPTHPKCQWPKSRTSLPLAGRHGDGGLGGDECDGDYHGSGDAAVHPPSAGPASAAPPGRLLLR